MMMTIHPHRGVDSIAFGMTRAEVAQAVGQVPRRGRRNQYDASDYDFFDQQGFFVYYDEDDRCHAVEFTRAAKVSYDGYDLFGHSAHDARAWARARDQDMDASDGFVSTALGLSMYAPSIDEEDLDEEEREEPAVSFLVFPPGYYEAERKRLETLKTG